MSLYSLAWRVLLVVCLVFNGGDGLPRAVAGAAASVVATTPAAAMADCPMHAGKAANDAAKAATPAKAPAGDDCCGGAQCHCAGAHGSLLAMTWPLPPRLAPAVGPTHSVASAHEGAMPDRLLRPPIA